MSAQCADASAVPKQAEGGSKGLLRWYKRQMRKQAGRMLGIGDGCERCRHDPGAHDLPFNSDTYLIPQGCMLEAKSPSGGDLRLAGRADGIVCWKQAGGCGAWASWARRGDRRSTTPTMPSRSSGMPLFCSTFKGQNICI